MQPCTWCGERTPTSLVDDTGRCYRCRLADQRERVFTTLDRAQGRLEHTQDVITRSQHYLSSSVQRSANQRDTS